MNYARIDINIFSETRFVRSDSDSMYAIDGYSLFRNDSQSSVVPRPYGGTAVFSRIDFMPGYPCCHNINGIEITTMKVTILPHVTS